MLRQRLKENEEMHDEQHPLNNNNKEEEKAGKYSKEYWKRRESRRQTITLLPSGSHDSDEPATDNV